MQGAGYGCAAGYAREDSFFEAEPSGHIECLLILHGDDVVEFGLSACGALAGCRFRGRWPQSSSLVPGWCGAGIQIQKKWIPHQVRNDNL